MFFLIIYYVIIAVGGSYILYFLFDSGEGGDSGLWAYGMILGVILSPILLIIMTVKKINKK